MRQSSSYIASKQARERSCENEPHLPKWGRPPDEPRLGNEIGPAKRNMLKGDSMQEYLWEIWMGKNNVHHRIQMNVTETPGDVFQRIVHQFAGTDKAIPTTRRDPNTGQEVQVKWKFSCRSQGKELPLRNHGTFEEQNVNPDSLIVVREVELRANTIYIDGFDGLADEEMAAARSKTPLILGVLFLLLAGGGAGYYFGVYAPQQAALAPYKIAIPTKPEGAKVMIVMDVSKVPKKKVGAKAPKAPKGADDGGEKLQRIKITTPSKNVAIPKKAKIIFIEITKKGFKPFTAGHDLEKWGKDRAGLKKLLPLDAKELTAKNFFPAKLEKAPDEPKFKALPAPTPKEVEVKYPRRFRRFALGLDPLHGGLDKQGANGVSGKTAGDLNLALSQVVYKRLKQRKMRRRYRIYTSRTKDADISIKRRQRSLRRARHAIVQFNFASGVKELPEASKNLKKGGKLIPYNDAVAGFQIYWSKKNRAAQKTQKLAKCMGEAMKQAGFTPRAPKKGEDKSVGELGIRSFDSKNDILNGKTPAIRLVPGYISHRAEDAVLNKAETHTAIATAIEAAMICYKKR